MREFGVLFGILAAFGVYGSFTGLFDGIVEVAADVHQYDHKEKMFKKKLRLLEVENKALKAKIVKLIAEKEHTILSIRPKKAAKRKIASVKASDKVNDLVLYDLYKWSPTKMLDLGEQSLHFKKYEKSAQFFNTLIDKHEKSELITDQVLFNAGVAAFESKQHYDWAQKHFSNLVREYPRSKFSRRAKLWLALAYYKTGDTKRFMSSVEEFRLKYRNTKEWQVISRFYEDIAYKYRK